MFYTRAHVQALEAQIVWLKGQLANVTAERCTRSHVQALEAEIAWLKEQLADLTVERRQLQDRLLARANVEPITQKPQPKLPETVQIVTPFGNGATPEIVDAMKESWMGEEAAYLMSEHGLTEEQAKVEAERGWLAQHKAE